MLPTDPTKPPAFSATAIRETEDFLQSIRQIRAANPKADHFFRDMLELMEDYEMMYRDDLTDEHRYWLSRMGRILGYLGEDPFPTLTFTRTEDGHDHRP